MVFLRSPLGLGGVLVVGMARNGFGVVLWQEKPLLAKIDGFCAFACVARLTERLEVVDCKQSAPSNWDNMVDGHFAVFAANSAAIATINELLFPSAIRERNIPMWIVQTPVNSELFPVSALLDVNAPAIAAKARLTNPLFAVFIRVIMPGFKSRFNFKLTSAANCNRPRRAK